MLTDWFARKNVDDTVIFATIFITGTNQVCSITDNIFPLQSGSVFYERAKLTGAQYKHRFIFTLDGNHRVIFTSDGNHRVIFTLDDHMTIGLNQLFHRKKVTNNL